MKRPKVRKAALSVRTFDDVKEAFERAAHADRRTLAQFIENELIEVAKKKGYLPADWAVDTKKEKR